MNERTNPTKWLQYLLYAGIAAMVNSLLSLLLGQLSSWIAVAISAATVFLLFKLESSNEHYQTAAVLYTVSLIISVLGLLGINMLGLVGSICALVAQYKEYHSHGELIEERDPKLAGKWGSLFWFQFAASIIVVLLTGVFVGVLVAAASMDAAVVTALATVIAAVLTLVLKVLYLVYLNRTIKLLETEILV